jgi:hypothetical protein
VRCSARPAFSVANLVVGQAGDCGGWPERTRAPDGEARRAGKYSSAVLRLLGIVLSACSPLDPATTTASAGPKPGALLTDQTLKISRGSQTDVNVTRSTRRSLAPRPRSCSSATAPPRLPLRIRRSAGAARRLADLRIEGERLEGSLLNVAMGKDRVQVKDLTEVALAQAILKLSVRRRRGSSRRTQRARGRRTKAGEKTA